ncbi:MAG: hypothetical protein ACRD5G_13030 [Candidatus Acidiferrales bacterium]
MWLALTLVVLHFCVFYRLDAIGLTGPDEPRYAAIAREMAESGDWVTPRLHGQPWFEKPALYYWDAALRYKIWGNTEFSARSPSAAAAAATTLVLGWLALQVYGWQAAAVVMLLFPTTVAVVGFGRAATTDMLFATSLAMAMTAAARIVLLGPRTTVAAVAATDAAEQSPGLYLWIERLWRCGFGAALGLAALAKGPAALVLAGGSVGLWMLVTRRWKDGCRLLHPLAVLSFMVVALPWYVLCAMRNPEFVDVFLIAHNFQRYLTPVFRHEQPFWFFGPILLLGFVPWTPLLVAVVYDAVALLRKRAWTYSASLFVACWVIFPVVFFSLSKSKLPGYVLPAIPALALLLARTLSKRMEARRHIARWLQFAISAVLLLLAAGTLLPSTAAQLPGVTLNALRLLALLGGAGAMLVAVFAWQRQNLRGVAAAAITVAALAAAITTTLLPAMDPHISARAAARRVLEAQAQGGGDVAVHKLHRAWHYGLNYYLKRDVPAWSWGDEARLVVTSEAGLADLEAQGKVAYVLDRVARQAIIIRLREQAPAGENGGKPPHSTASPLEGH